MNRTLLIVMIVAAAIALGIGGAYAVSRALPNASALITGIDSEYAPNGGEFRLPDCMGRYSGRTGGRGWSDEWRGGMHGGVIPWNSDTNATGERISIDDALAQAEAYIAQISDDLQVSEVMEFTGNFYAVVIESDSGKGAMELLIDPYTGRVTPEIGPNMMWNAKYGHMRRQIGGADNTLSLSEAAAAAQQALDEQVPGAVLEEHGIDFYGYYSFDYSLDGEIAGMLSVNGTDGRVWLHTWHGEFIGEKEIE